MDITVQVRRNDGKASAFPLAPLIQEVLYSSIFRKSFVAKIWGLNTPKLAFSMKWKAVISRGIFFNWHWKQWTYYCRSSVLVQMRTDWTKSINLLSYWKKQKANFCNGWALKLGRVSEESFSLKMRLTQSDPLTNLLSWSSEGFMPLTTSSSICCSYFRLSCLHATCFDPFSFLACFTQKKARRKTVEKWPKSSTICSHCWVVENLVWGVLTLAVRQHSVAGFGDL